MKPVVALLLALSLAACFPNSAKHRTYAKLAEGAALAAGIGILYAVNSGADCDENRMPGAPASDWRDAASMTSTIGLGLIIAGLSGFIVTVSTSPEDKPANTLAPTPAPVSEDETGNTSQAPTRAAAAK